MHNPKIPLKIKISSITVCVPVQATKLETSLTLHTDHVGVGCDRDTYSLASQRKEIQEYTIYIYF